MLPLSCVDTAQLEGEGDAVNGQHVCSDPIIHRVLLCVGDDMVEVADHQFLQTGIDHVLVPEETLPVLDPFKIRYCDSTRVGENVRDDENAFPGENYVRIRRGRA